MINICHIVSGDLWAGAEAMVYSLLQGLKRFPDLGLKVLVLNDGLLFRRLRRAGFDAVVIDESRLGPVRLHHQVKRAIAIARPSVIHAHRYKENLLAYLAARGFPRTALVATQHGLIEKYAAFSSLKQRLIHKANFTLMARKFHKVVVVSGQMKATMETGNGFRGGNIVVIHNGIALPERPAVSSAPGDSLVIGSCGRLVPVKDFGLMVEIARRVVARSPKIRFVIAGEGPERDRLMDLIRHYDLTDRFELPGHMDDMAAFYHKIDVFMNTSIHEGIPMSVLEAMSYGRPVIAPQVGGLPEILADGRQGFLIPGHDTEEYASRCLALWDHPDLLRRMGAAARRRIEEGFSVSTMARNYYDLYTRLVSQA